MICRPEYDMKVVGNNLKRLRVAKNLSVDDVRQYLQLGSVQAIYKYEKGKSYPQTDTMFALMELYDANLYDITKEHEEDDKSSSAHIREYKKAA
jgi:transcriptional regulator with XRE-family HTH domain